MDVRPSASLLPYRLGPIPIEVRAEAADVRQAVPAVLEYFGLRLWPSADAPPVARLDFAPPSSAALPNARPAEARLVRHHNGMDVWRAGDAWWLCERDNTVRLDFPKGRASGTIRSPLWATAGTLYLPFVNLVIHSLLLLLRREGYVPLHTAALAKDGVGVLLTAASDSGKSTQALGLVRAGWQYLTDDSALLYLSGVTTAGNTIEVLPLRRDFGLDQAAEAVFPEMVPHTLPFLTDERKRRVNMATLYPGQATERCVPRLLLFPQIRDQPQSQLLPLSQKDALLGLMQQSPFLALDPDVAAPHLDLLRTLAGQAAGYRLFAGHDLRDHPERLADLLAPVLPQPTSLA